MNEETKIAAFLKAARYRLIQLMFDYDFEVFESFSALSAMAWGATIFFTNGIYERSLSYATFNNFIPENVLGLVAFLVGFIQGGLMFMDLRPIRMHFSLAVFTFWLFLAIGFMMSPLTPSFFIYLIYAAFALGNYVNLTLHHGYRKH